MGNYMSVRNVRSNIGIIADTITFPIRALFMLTEGKFGLSSLREERMRVVSKFCSGRVLDIGCGRGNLFINEYIGNENGVGVDIYPYEGVENVIEDAKNLPFENNTFNTITLIAVGGHIPYSDRVAEFKEFSRVLKTGGVLIMTEGEPITQYLVHKWSDIYSRLHGELDMDTERGMEEDEQYCMPTSEILTYMNTRPLKLIKRYRFMWYLNNAYVAEKIN